MFRHEDDMPFLILLDRLQWRYGLERRLPAKMMERAIHDASVSPPSVQCQAVPMGFRPRLFSQTTT